MATLPNIITIGKIYISQVSPETCGIVPKPGSYWFNNITNNLFRYDVNGWVDLKLEAAESGAITSAIHLSCDNTTDILEIKAKSIPDEGYTLEISPVKSSQT